MWSQTFYTIICFLLFGYGVAQKRAIGKCDEFVASSTLLPQIVGGVRTAVNEFPHMAALGYGEQENREWLCGGSLISDQFVLTAAHCTNMSYLGPVKLVRLGTRTLSQENYQDIPIIEIIQHPDYIPPIVYNDIALLKLQHEVAFSRNILPACLNTLLDVNATTNTLIALGWGKTDFAGPVSDDLLKVHLGISQDSYCISSYRRASIEKLPDGVKPATQLCAGGEERKDTCQGDSGGPLEYKNGRSHHIVGVTAFGKACGISKTPGVYTRVSAFVPWIESIVWP